ncbi:MAG TPA: hypothetical protein VE078_18125 [Thermoanaerobaculia bacterium]|nr:hypothetical protein [Thermoanaerobaculia bacterium]
MISRKAFWSIALAVAVVGVGAGMLVANVFAPQPSAHAAWKDVFEAPSQLARGVDSIVLAKAVGVEPGRVAYSSDGKDFLSYQVHEFEVIRGVKGAQTGERVFVERAGGPGIVLDVDGGEFEMGATYLLFLNKQDDGPYHFQVNHQGRYLVSGNRLYGIDPNDSVSEFFEGKPVSEGLSLVRGYLREGPQQN